MTKTAARLALILALVGLGASAYAAYVHYRLLFDPTYLSLCDVNATVSCTQVYLSRYSTMAGVPVAILGGLWFVAAGLLAIGGMVARPAVRESIPGYLFVMSTVALAVILYLGYASFFVLKLVCLVCLTTYAAVVGLFIVSGAASKISMTTLPRRAASDLRVFSRSPLAIALALFFLAGAGTTLAFFPREAGAAAAASGAAASPSQAAGAEQGALPAATEAQQAEFERWYVAQPRVASPADAEGAKVVIVKFNDFQCPPCRQTHMMYTPIIRKIQAENPGAVKYVLKDFPLESECNATIQNGGPHPASCEAAVAVRLARAAGTEEAMIEWIFGHQPELTPQLVKQGVVEAGKVSDFDAKYAATLPAVKADIAQGQLLQVRSTPTFFINGVKVKGGIAPQYFEQAIKYELAHSK